jgi:hypothetical protein
MRTILQGKAILIGLLLAAGVLMAQGPARADTISAIIAADNHFTFYVGDATGSDLTYIGRNMYGDGDDNGYNWQQAVTFTNVTVKPGQYLYVAAWDDGAPHMWVGEFTLPDGTKLYSNTSDWVSKVGSGDNPGIDGDLVYSTVKLDIQAAGWTRPEVQEDFTSGIWPQVDGGVHTFDPDTLAKYLWHDDFDDSASNDHYAIFRTAAPVTHIPVPSTVLLLGSGLAGLGLLRGKWSLGK